MRRRIKLIYDMLSRIYVAGDNVDLMSAARQELKILDQQVKLMNAQIQPHADPVGAPGDPGVPVTDVSHADHSGPAGEPGPAGKEEPHE